MDYDDKEKKEIKETPEYVSSPCGVEAGKCCNPFKKYYEKGHDPLLPYIEFTCPITGKTKRKAPESKSYYITDLTDKEIGNYLSPAQLKCVREQAKEREKIGKRDVCKEMRESKEAEEKDRVSRLEVLEERETVWLQQAKEQEDKVKRLEAFKELTSVKMEKLASLIAQLIPK